jgi:hypothetical protein
VRDAVAFEARGLPAVVVVLDALSEIAHATAASSGAHDLAIVPLDAVLFGRSKQDVGALAGSAARQAVALLTQPLS